MPYLFINLKRFDIPRSLGGVCDNSNPGAWITSVIEQGQSLEGFEAVYFLPEALILTAAAVKPADVQIGCQGVYRQDIVKGGNFGAFTSQLPATAARHYGCEWAIIGHSEERRDKDDACLNAEAVCAAKAGLRVLYCIGETAEQTDKRYEVLRAQLRDGLSGVETQAVIGYEPVWAIGPGKTPPGADYIGEISAFIKEEAKKLLGYTPAVVYGGGLKKDNAAMLASIATIDGGLVALTRFQGEIGFYPEELREIAGVYLNAKGKVE